MNIYWEVLIITAVLAFVFRNHKKAFVVSAAGVHIFVCGFRYKFMHGDLMRYNTEFMDTLNYGWLDDKILREGRNTLFYMLNKFIAEFFDGNFQVLLFVITLISIVSISVVIYRYSPAPFISFVMWSCFGFYIFSFYSIKQTLAMGFVMFAAIAIFEERRLAFYVLAITAGFIHLPAFIFLPAYELCRVKKVKTVAGLYAVAFIVIFLFRNQIVSSMADVYYDSEKYADVAFGIIGGKAILFVAILISSYLLCGFSEEISRKTFTLVAVASLLQLFSVYDNVFTRLADYYFQFIILLAPYMLKQIHAKNKYPPLYFNYRSQKILTMAFICLALVFYYSVNLSGDNVKPVDDLIGNFAFMWQVQ